MKYGLNIIIIFYFMDFICYSLFIMVFLWHIIKIRMTKSDKKILEGAFRLFLNADYERASTSDLEAEIGLTRGAIYYSYKSNEELFKAVIALSWTSRMYCRRPVLRRRLPSGFP